MVRTRAAAAVVGIALGAVALAGCGSDSDAQEPAAESPAQESSTTSSSEPTTTTAPSDPATDCLVGVWALDTGDYQAQAFDYMSGLGIPVEALSIDGEQVVEFQERGVMEVRTDLSTYALVFGQPLTVDSQSFGNGEWSTDGDGLVLENWIWGVEPAPTATDGPSVPFFDPTAGSTTSTCEGDTLTLQGAGAPLSATFVRR